MSWHFNTGFIHTYMSYARLNSRQTFRAKNQLSACLHSFSKIVPSCIKYQSLSFLILCDSNAEQPTIPQLFVKTSHTKKDGLDIFQNRFLASCLESFHSKIVTVRLSFLLQLLHLLQLLAVMCYLSFLAFQSGDAGLKLNL